MLESRSTLRRATLPAACALLGLAPIALWTVDRAAVPVAVAAAPMAGRLPDTLGFEVRYAGIGAEGVDMVWRGRMDGPVPGLVTIRMEYAGSPAGRQLQVWPVNVWLFSSAEDYRNSFVAELSGRMHWGVGEMRVTGLVSDGVQADTPVEVRMRVERPALEGGAMVRFYRPISAANPGWPPSAPRVRSIRSQPGER